MPGGQRAAARSPRSARWPTATSPPGPDTPDFLWVRALAIEAFYSDFVAPGVDATGPGRRSTSTPPSPRGWRRTGPTWASDERALRRRRRRLGRRRRNRGGRARPARPQRAAAGVRPAPDRGRLHALGGEGDLRAVLADPLRADRRRRRRRGRACSAAAASAAARPSTRRWRCARTPRTSPSGTPPADSPAATARRSARPTWRRTTTGSRRAWACASATTGRRRAHRRARLPRARRASSSRCSSYTDANCMRCGSCLQGCPTNAGKSTLNTYIHDAWATGQLELRAGAYVERVVIEDGEAEGVEYVDGDGLPSAWTRARSSSPAGRSTRRRSCMRSGLPGQPEQPSGRPQPRLPPGPPRLRAVRRAAGRAHGVSDHGARDGPPARRGRRLRRRGRRRSRTRSASRRRSRTRTVRSGARRSSRR